jgi:hypothetical protein
LFESRQEMKVLKPNELINALEDMLKAKDKVTDLNFVQVLAHS